LRIADCGLRIAKAENPLIKGEWRLWNMPVECRDYDRFFFVIVKIPMIVIREPTIIIARTITVSVGIGLLELSPRVSRSFLIDRMSHNFRVPSAPPVANVEPHTGEKASAVTVVS